MQQKDGQKGNYVLDKVKYKVKSCQDYHETRGDTRGKKSQWGPLKEAKSLNFQTLTSMTLLKISPTNVKAKSQYVYP